MRWGCEGVRLDADTLRKEFWKDGLPSVVDDRRNAHHRGTVHFQPQTGDDKVAPIGETVSGDLEIWAVHLRADDRQRSDVAKGEDVVEGRRAGLERDKLRQLVSPMMGGEREHTE